MRKFKKNIMVLLGLFLMVITFAGCSTEVGYAIDIKTLNGSWEWPVLENGFVYEFQFPWGKQSDDLTNSSFRSSAGSMSSGDTVFMSITYDTMNTNAKVTLTVTFDGEIYKREILEGAGYFYQTLSGVVD